MARMLEILSVLAIFFSYGQSLQCPSCRDSDCNELYVPELECNRHIAQLPYGNLKSDSVSAEFACMTLEYQTGTKLILVQQCHVVNPSKDICADLKLTLSDSVKLKNCDYVLSSEEDPNPDSDNNEDANSSTDDPSSTSTKISTTTKTSTTTKPSTTTKSSTTTKTSTTTKSSTTSNTEDPSTSTTENPNSSTTDDPSSTTTEDSTTDEVTTLKTSSTTSSGNATILSITALVIALTIQKFV